MNELAQVRETGSQKSGISCPICGGSVPAVTSLYGSVSVGACPICWPGTADSQLAAQVAAADALIEETQADEE